MFCSETKEIKKTRKPHQCTYCNRIIPIGNKAYSWFYSWGGTDSGSGYSCCPCENSKLVDKQDYQDGDEISGDISDYIQGNEYPDIKCPKCGSHNFDSWEWSENQEDMIFTCKECKTQYSYKYGFGKESN